MSLVANVEHLGLAKAQYATGYFTEMGIGCRRDPLEANVWYVRAADQGDERAKRRLAAIQAVASGRPDPAYSPTGHPGTVGGDTMNKLSKTKKRFGVF
jgi:TPR repeat protein